MKIKMVPVNESHALKRWEALSHPDIAKWMFIDLPVSYQKTLEWCKSISSKPNRKDFCFEVNGVVAGFAGLVNINHINQTSELYIFLHPGFLSKGLGGFFLNSLISFGKLELGLRKISLWVTGDNDKAICFYKKNGFFTEGVLRRHVWFRGKYRDRVIMSIFTNDFTADVDSFYSEVL